MMTTAIFILVCLTLVYCDSELVDQDKERIYEHNTYKCGTDKFPRDCQDIMEHTSNCSGQYVIHVGPYQKRVSVYCDMESDPGKAWTVIQRRMDGSENFYRNWADYQKCFGDIGGEHWVGNDALYLLTHQGSYGLRFDMRRFNGGRGLVDYSTFKVGPAADDYILTISGFSSSDPDIWADAMAYHNGQRFSTHDKDNDTNGGNCAVGTRGGWWFGGCYKCMINGSYKPLSKYLGLIWHYSIFRESLQFVEMKVHRLKK